MPKEIDYSECANSYWTITRNDGGGYPTEQVKLALLMDIREELRKLNRVVGCSNTIAIPGLLREIQQNTKKRAYKKRKKKIIK